MACTTAVSSARLISVARRSTECSARCMHAAGAVGQQCSSKNNSEDFSLLVTFLLVTFRSRPGKPNQRKGQNEKFMNSAHFCVNSGVFSSGKQARFTNLTFVSGMPLRKVHELTFLWFAGATPDAFSLAIVCLENSVCAFCGALPLFRGFFVALTLGKFYAHSP